MLHQDTQTLADEIIGDFIRLFVSRDIRLLMGPDRLVDGIGKALFKEGIQIGVQEDPVAGLAVEIQCRMQTHRSFGQGSRLIGTEHIHAPEVFYGCQPLDNDLLLGHLFGAVGQVDADNGRQQLRCQPDRQRQGKKKGFKNGPMKVDIHGKNNDHQGQGHFEQEKAEPADALFKLRFLGLSVSAVPRFSRIPPACR